VPRAFLVALLLAPTAAAQPAQDAFSFDPAGKPLTDASRAVQALAYSPDGKLLAVAGEGGVIDLWDVRDRKVAKSLTGHTAVVTALAWSKDGRRLVSASTDKTAIVWDPAAAKAIHTWKHPAAVYAVAVAPDGKTVATGGFDTAVRLWDADTGAETAKLEGHTASVRCLAFDPAGELLASGGSDFCVRLWKPMTKDAPKELRAHTRTVRGLAFVGPGRLASGGDDATAFVWSVATGDPVHTFGPFADAVTSMAAAPRGGFVVAGLGNGRLHVCDPATGTKRSLLSGPTDAVAAVAVAPDGQSIAAGGFDKVVRLWTPAPDPGTAVVTFADQGVPVRATAVSPDGTRVATAGADGHIRVFHAVTGAVQTKWPAHDGAIEDIAYSRDGSALVSGGADGKAKVWKVADQSLTYTHKLAAPVRRVALSKTGALGAASTGDADVAVFDVAAKSEKRFATEAVPAALAFLPDDLLLTAGGPRAYLWDVAAGRVSETIDNNQFVRITAAAVGADGKLVVLAGDPAPGTFRPEDAGTCRVMAASRHNPGDLVTMRMNDTGVSAVRAAVAADGRMVVVVGGDGTVRAWEWPDGRLVRKFATHTAPVPGLALSSRGEFAVTASADGTARRWPASKGEPLVFAARLTDESKQTWFARLSPDCKVLATGGDDGVLRLRRGAPGAYRPIAGDFPAVFTAVMSPDGSVLATGHLDGTIHVWDTKTWKELHKLDRHAHRVWALAFSPDGTRLVSGGGNWDDTQPGEVRVWDTATWKTVHEVAAHDDLVFSVAVAADNKTFATGSKNGSIIVWDLGTVKPGLTLQGGGSARCLWFAPDSRLFSCGAGHLLQWWDPKTGKLLGTGNGRFVNSERFAPTPDGKHLALAAKVGNTEFVAGLWDVEKNDLVREFAGRHVGQINAIAVSPDGRTVVTGGGEYNTAPRFVAGPGGPWGVPITVNKDGRATLDHRPACELKCWDLETGKPVTDLAGHKFWAETIAFSPDGTTLITAGGVKDQPGELRTWDGSALRPITSVKAGGGLSCGQFSPDGRLFATGTTNGGVALWTVTDALAGTEGRPLGRHNGLVRSVAWSRDGKLLASSGEDGGVQVWTAPFEGPPKTFPAHDRTVYGLAFSPDGTRLVTAAGDYKTRKAGEVRIWDPVAGAEVFRLPDAPETVWGVAFLGPDQLLTAQSGTAVVKVWDLKTRKEQRSLTAPLTARGLSVSPDGKWVVLTSGNAGTIKVWEAGTWREAHEVDGHPGEVVFGADFAADGQTVLSAGGDGAAVVWKLPGGDWKLPEFTPPPPRRQTPVAPKMIGD
jgi:WD40 repeat protein